MNTILSVALTLWCVTGTASENEDIGSFYQCAHGLRGRVWVKNDREIMIQGFNYDGKGPAAWFHGQLRPAPKGVSTADPSSYVTLPYPDDSCARLTPGRSYADENITLILPRSIKDFETIGILCYQYCHNFGHIIIPKDLNVPPAPGSLLSVSECEKPNYDACPSPRRGELRPDCAAGAGRPAATDAVVKLTLISGWLLFTLFLALEKL